MQVLDFFKIEQILKFDALLIIQRAGQAECALGASFPYTGRPIAAMLRPAEGDTDPERYRELVGCSAAEVRAGRCR